MSLAATRKQNLATRAWRRLRRTFTPYEHIVYRFDGVGADQPTLCDIRVERFDTDLPSAVVDRLIEAVGARELRGFRALLEKQAVLWVAFIGDAVAGHLWTQKAQHMGRWYMPLQPDDVVIFSVVTRPDHKGKGAAPALCLHAIDAIASRAGNLPCRFYLDCETWNTVAQRSFMKAGFVPIALAHSLHKNGGPPLPTVVQAIDRNLWTKLIGRFASWDYQQGYSYSLHAAAGARENVEAVAIFHDGTLIGLATARIRRLPFTPFRAAYIAAGPVYSETNGDLTYPLCAQALQRYFGKATQLLRVMPAAASDAQAADQAQVSTMLGYVPVPQDPYHTILKQIDLPDAALRSSFQANWRGHLGKSEREPLTVTCVSGDRDRELFTRMHAALAHKKNFETAHGPAFFCELLQKAMPPEQFVLHIAWQGDEAVAGHLGSISGDTAVYLLGASTESGRALRAAYLLQWEFIRFARDHGARWYDLGGIDPVGNPAVYSFKKGLRGQELRWAGSFDSFPYRWPVMLLHRVEQVARR